MADVSALDGLEGIEVGMRTIDGRITLAQEGRFQLTDEHGISHLFLLSPWATAEPAQLRPLAARQAKVRVTFKKGDDVIAGLARRIDLQGATATESKR